MWAYYQRPYFSQAEYWSHDWSLPGLYNGWQQCSRCGMNASLFHHPAYNNNSPAITTLTYNSGVFRKEAHGRENARMPSCDDEIVEYVLAV